MSTTKVDKALDKSAVVPVVSPDEAVEPVLDISAVMIQPAALVGNHDETVQPELPPHKDDGTEVAPLGIMTVAEKVEGKETVGEEQKGFCARYRKMLLEDPESTPLGRAYHYTMLFVILLNLIELMCETLDGPNKRSTQPAYPYLPDAKTYVYFDYAFTLIFTLDLCMKSALAKNQKKVCLR
jgi:hypothetical protein